MILILTNSRDATADFLMPYLEQASVEHVRLDTDRLIQELAFSYASNTASFTFQGRKYHPGNFKAVWYRRPERLCSSASKDLGEESYSLNEWSEALEGFLAVIPNHRWMNHPSAIASASHKLEQLATAVRIGLNIPSTLVTQDPDELQNFYRQHDGKVITKPLSNGMVVDENGTEVSLIYTNLVTASDLNNLTDLPTCPTLFQECVDKQYDVRITVVDTEFHAFKLFATDEKGAQRCDIRRNNMEDVRYENCALPSEIQQKLTGLMLHYGLRFAAIDMAVTKAGDWVYFEINPNGQWAWLDMCAGSRIRDSFIHSFNL